MSHEIGSIKYSPSMRYLLNTVVLVKHRRREDRQKKTPEIESVKYAS